jgi:ribosomal protein S18 acetylase RimI-like enzyme
LALVARDYAGAADLRRMQRLVQDVWALNGAKAAQHVGDLAWQRFQHVGREPLWRTRLWEEDDRTTAYGWVFEEDALDFCIHPERLELLDTVLEWAQARTTSTLDSMPPTVSAALDRHGLEQDLAAPYFVQLARELHDTADPAPPDGFTLRTVGDSDVAGRVEAHRSAFQPSRVTVESYRNVMKAWPYRSDLDCIAVAPDGRIAAYCLAWLDDENRVGELEPVGTHADFRRRGLAAAVCSFALSRLADAGAKLAVVYARGDAAFPAPKRLYESLGFRAHARAVTYRFSA